MSTPQVQQEIPRKLTVGDEFGYWFSGFFDGEGCFIFKHTVRGVSSLVPKIKVAVRADDRNVIDHIRSELGCGSVYSNQYKSEAYQTHKPWVDFRVQRIAELAEVIVPLFERYPLHTKKQQEFLVWKEVVLLRYSNRGKSHSLQEQTLCERINELITKWRHR